MISRDSPLALRLGELYAGKPIRGGETAKLSRGEVEGMMAAVREAKRKGRVGKDVARRELKQLRRMATFLETSHEATVPAVLVDPIRLGDGAGAQRRRSRKATREARKKNRPQKKRTRG